MRFTSVLCWFLLLGSFGMVLIGNAAILAGWNPSRSHDDQIRELPSPNHAKTPVTEIWSGKALNDCLERIQELHKRKIHGPKITLEAKVLDKINVTRGEKGGHIGLLKNDGPLCWPKGLKTAVDETERMRIDGLFSNAVKQAKKGEVDDQLTGELGKAVRKMHEQLDEHLMDLKPDQNDQYIEAKRYLRLLDRGITTLRRKDVQVYFTAMREIPRKCRTVEELVQYLSEKKLRFASTVPGEEIDYIALHKALAAYLKEAGSRRDKK